MTRWILQAWEGLVSHQASLKMPLSWTVYRDIFEWLYSVKPDIQQSIIAIYSNHLALSRQTFRANLFQVSFITFKLKSITDHQEVRFCIHLRRIVWVYCYARCCNIIICPWSSHHSHHQTQNTILHHGHLGHNIEHIHKIE